MADAIMNMAAPALAPKTTPSEDDLSLFSGEFEEGGGGGNNLGVAGEGLGGGCWDGGCELFPFEIDTLVGGGGGGFETLPSDDDP